jgi:hypothetical protein
MSAQRINDYRTGEVTLVPFPRQEPAWQGGEGPVSRRWLTAAEVAAIRERDAADFLLPMLPVRGIMARAEIDARRRLDGAE